MTGSFLGPTYAYIAILSCIGAFAGSPPIPGDDSHKSGWATYKPHLLLIRGSSLPLVDQSAPPKRSPGVDELAGWQKSPNHDSEAPPYLGGRVFFRPDSVALSAGGKRMLTQTAKWLNQHPNARVLIVGLCDPTGSEGCRRSLAQKRGKVVHDFLVSQSVRETQIEAVLGWEKNAEPCRATAEACQKLNRTTRVFVASTMASGREDDGNRK